MQPEVRLRIETMIKALDDVVIPELVSGSAIEQATLVRGSLQLLQEQFDHIRGFAHADLKSFSDLCDKLAQHAHAGDEVVAAEIARSSARAAAADARASLADLNQHNRALRSAACALIREEYSGADPERQKGIERITLRHAQSQTDRERAWVHMTGFDIFPNEVQTVAAASTPGD